MGIDSEVTRHAPGVWSIPVPIPDSPLGYTLVYVLESDQGPYLVDAGWDTPSGLTTLTDGLASLGTSINDVRGVFVTHFHPDHHGLAGAVREASGAFIALHRKDAAIVDGIRRETTGGPARRVGNLLRVAGAPEAALMAQEVVQRTPRPMALPDRLLDGGELLDAGGRTLRAVWTPGHSPGHTCFHMEDIDTLLAGDHLLPGITPHIGLFDDRDPDSDPLGSFLESLAKVAALDVRHVLPAHRQPFEGSAQRAAEIRAHHEQRFAGIIDFLGDGERTLWDIAAAMEWNKDWSEMPPSNQPMALAEAGAHLRHLAARGSVEMVPGSDPLRFRRVDAPRTALAGPVAAG